MTFSFTYEPEFQRVIPAVEIDARASNPAIRNQIGDVIKSFTDGKVALVTDNVIVYRIETDDGNLGGYFTVQVSSGVATLQFSTLRPAFVQFSPQIFGLISKFVQSGQWQADYLT